MPRSPDSDDSFLSRWSRRKRAQATPDVPDVETPAVAPQSPIEDEVLAPEDLAQLPALDDLTPDSDIKAFLQKGVPKALRNAALRRKWMLAPGIRDHKDPAVDYAWDWNTPGGVPGDGHPPSPERAAQMLRDLIAPRHNSAPSAADEADSNQDDAAPQTSAAADAQTPEGPVHPPEPQLVSVRISAAPAKTPAPGPDAVKPDDHPAVSRKRHGGALPG
ncbi:DUF3306 domain-containing protein [Tabrizicola sp. WMC-M-20]|nr:DUF3306 domain-containing protein [Tabrizicola sp. WMC-M-20]